MQAGDTTGGTAGPTVTGQAGIRPQRRAAWLVLALLWLLAVSVIGLIQDPKPDPLSAAGRLSFEGLRYPLERNAFLRLPLIGSDLRGLHVSADGRKLWAVGSGGTIVHSADGGGSWSLQVFAWPPGEIRPAPTIQPPREKAASTAGWSLISEARADAVPDPTYKSANPVQQNADPAQNPIQQQTLPPKDAKPAVKEPPAGKARPAADPNRIRPPPTPAASRPPEAKPATSVAAPPAPAARPLPRPDLESVFFLADGRRGWAAGTEGILLTTSDGGQHWQAGFPGAADTHWLAVGFTPDGATGWLLARQGVLYRRTGAAEPWRIVAELGALGHGLVDGATQRIAVITAAGELLSSRDGGMTWNQPLGTQTGRRPQLKRVLSLAGDLFLVRTAQSGLLKQQANGSWEAVSAATTVPLTALRESALGVFSVGDAGSIFRASALSRPPVPLSQGRAGVLHKVRIDDTGQGSALGFAETPYRSSDGGRSWTPVDSRYARFPAPWLWLAWCAGFIALGGAAMQRPQPAGNAIKETIADAFASDRPLLNAREDRLGFAPLAWGLSAFLRNEKTEPPLTIAITGDWGSGKSSLMSLLREDLARFGVRSVWFNAWHHQKEEALLAALLAAIGEQAIPDWFSLEGVGYRLRLLWTRGRRYWLLSLAVTFSLGLFGWVLSHPGNALENWFRFAGELWTAIFGEAKNAPADSEILAALKGLGITAGALVPVVTALLRLRAFGVRPGELVASLTGKATVKDLGAQAGFRQKFAEQFAEVTAALEPRTMLVLIDDLDRCKPEAVLEVMEAVNFLVSSGRVFVVLGMARERVEACVGLAFEKVANEMVETGQIRTAEGALPDDKEMRARLVRREYARQYLEKLINIEVPVPRLEPAESRLLQDDGAALAGAGSAFILPHWARMLCRLWPILIGIAMIALGAWVGTHFADTASTPGTAQSTAVATPAASAPRAPAASASAPVAEAAASGPAYFGPAEPARRPGFGWGVSAILLAALIGMLALVRRPSPVVRDSPAFRVALAIWNPLVAAAMRTPRAVKRYQNWVRYLAMIQRGQVRSPGFGDELRDLIRRILGRPAAPEAGPVVAGDDSPELVALGALERAIPDWEKRGILSGAAPKHENPAVQAALENALAAHAQRFPERNPARFIAEFRRLARGVRIDAPLREGVASAPPSRS